MSYYFSTPTAPTVPTWTKAGHPATPLMRHYQPWHAGINLFVVDGVVTTVEPDYELVTPEYVYLGGHLYTITEAEAALLTAAGYTVIEGAAAVVSPGLPGGAAGSDFPTASAPFGSAPFGSAPFGGGGGMPGSTFDSNFNSGTVEGLKTPGVGVGLLGVTSLGGI